MSHSLHREGSENTFRNGDYVFISRPAMGFNDKGAAPKIKRTFEIIFEAGPTNFGSLTSQENMYMGVDPQKLIDRVEDNSPVMCCFHEREKMLEVVKKLKEEELGMSVIVTGLVDDVVEMCKEAGLTPHSVDISLGIFGNTDLLPDESIRCFTTMCGHGMIAASLVKQMKKAYEEGKVSKEEAAKVMSAPCLCGIFNTKRAEKLLESQKK
jgi:hypothetical protein